MEWQRLSTHEHARRRFTEALLPIGTLEAHDGGPIGTDNLIPEALCERLAERLAMPRLPLMPYGLTKSLLAYPGSCQLTAEGLEKFLIDVGLSLQRNGLQRLFVMNGHGGNTESLRRAAGHLFTEHRLYVAVIDWWWEVQTQAAEIFGKEGLGHAAVDEMGMLLGLHPEVRPGMPSGPVPSFYVYKGVQAYPAPRPVMTYERPDDPVDFSRLTPERCARFADLVTECMERIIREIQTGWGEIGA
ncbi:MAG: creatininase family protein [Candidatus Eisenbacteria bacterium]